MLVAPTGMTDPSPTAVPRFADVEATLRHAPKTWLVTGAAGFIGSHLVETLLGLHQRVVGVDNFATGKRENIDLVAGGNPLFTFYEGSVDDAPFMATVMSGVDVVLHQAALGSVPRSIKDPLASHRANVDGFIITLNAAREAGVQRFVYASSSSVYGDEPNLPKVEGRIGEPLSPYAATKRINEVYAAVFERTYGLKAVGLRYFNVFGPRQDKSGPYAAVIPVWVGKLLAGEACTINGDGETSRDFCYVKNAVEANILAATSPTAQGVYNVACGAQTTLNALFGFLRDGLVPLVPEASRASLAAQTPTYGPFRDGDVRHSLANTDKAAAELGYEGRYAVDQGLAEALQWYADNA